MNWTAFLIPVAIAVVFKILSYLFPSKPSATPLKIHSSEPPKWFEFLFGISLFALWFLITAAVAWSLYHISFLVMPKQNPNDLIFLRPDYIGFAAASMMASLVIAGLICEKLAIMFWPDFYAGYKEKQNKQSGVDWQRLEKPIYVGSITISLVFGILMMDYYTIFRSDRIISNSFLGFGATVYKYKELNKVEFFSSFRVRNGNIKNTPRLILTFNNGDVWSSRWAPVDIETKRLNEVATQIANKAGIELLSKQIREE